MNRFIDIKIILLLLGYILIQAMTLDYGKLINDTDHIRSFMVDPSELGSAYYNRESVAVKKSRVENENIDKWMTRFKTYGVEADEPVVLMALSRINPRLFHFDPHFYQYGGAFLYPLGGFLFLCMNTGILGDLNLDSFLNNPDLVDRVYFMGRFFVLICFTLSGCILWFTLKPFTSSKDNLLLIAVYLVMPVSIMFSQIMKPHWYALLWINLSLFILTRIFKERGISKTRIILLSLCIGLAVGSAGILSIYAFMVWISLIIAVKKKCISISILLTVPLISLIIFFLTNPYIILNHETFLLESEALKGWFITTMNPKYIFLFLKNSFLPDMGVFFGLFILVITVQQIISPKHNFLRYYAIAILIIIISISYICASMDFWHINVRYIPYILPCSLIFVALIPLKKKQSLLLMILLLTMLQSVPLKIAFFDENSQKYSTRLTAASWIDRNVPSGTSIYAGTQTLAPYDTPPFDFDKYNINMGADEYFLIIDRQMDNVLKPEGYELINQFKPRFSSGLFPLVFSHINPQISIYRRIKTNREDA